MSNVSNVINLNRFRKKKAREEAAQSADENRAKFGQTKLEKQKGAHKEEKLGRHIDNHEIEED